MQIEDHYGLLLGIHLPWLVSSVALSIENSKVDIVVEYPDDTGVCPECKQLCKRYDYRESRTWRHLDTMQFTTYVHSAVPRIQCDKHGIKTVDVPWAGKHSRFTLLFEGFAIRILQAARSIEEARKLLKLNWHQVNDIKDRAVERGLSRRKNEGVKFVGIDEKQFRSGHRYISCLADLDNGRILNVVEDRTTESCKTLINTVFNDKQKHSVKAVATDMWAPFLNAVSHDLPHSVNVLDRFHISQHLNKAVDAVRKNENKILLSEGDRRLVRSKFIFLSKEENLSDAQRLNLSEIRKSNLKTARAWAIKENFIYFWMSGSRSAALEFFEGWYSWAIRSQIEQIKEKARMIKNHLPLILNYFDYPITNAVSEGLNSKIQTIKANSRGFRSFENFRNSILFYCGKLEMNP